MKHLTNLTLSLLAVIALAISANAAITFEDNYTVTTGGGGINYEYNNGVRQSGLAAPVQYIVWSDVPTALPYVTNTGPTAGELYMPSDGSSWGNHSRWSPNYNFTESGDFSVEIIFNRTGDASWKALSICKENVLDGIFSSPGMSIMFFPNGSYTTMDGDHDHGIIGNFQFAELSYASSPVLKIKFVVSQLDFNGSTDALVALFINDKPYPIASSPNIFTHVHTNGFANNYISVFADGAIGVDNLKVATADGNVFSTLPWSSDADIGITNAKVYTHAIDLGNAENTMINGVLFTGTAATNSGSNWEVKNDTSTILPAYDATIFGLVPNVTGQGQFIITNVLYSGNPALTLTGLAPSQQYVLTLYFQGFTPYFQYAYVATSDGEMITVQNSSAMGDFNGELMSYQYTANADGVFSLSTTTTNSTAWALYAFSNEEVIPEPMVGIWIIGLLELWIIGRRK